MRLSNGTGKSPRDMLRTRGVAYCPWLVWVYPGRDFRPAFDDHWNFYIAHGGGNINDFVVNEF